jgi:hypothetical protein
MNPTCSAAAFEVNSEPHTGGRPSVRLCVGLIKKAQNLGVPWSAYRLYLHRGKAALAAMYLRRVRVVGRADCACGTKPRRGVVNARTLLIARGQNQQHVM